MTRHKATGLCLAMMAKNEEAVIRRALESARPHIDRWAVTDFGSTDGTERIVRDALSTLPGHQWRELWSNFAQGREVTVRHAAEERTDYILMMDADQTLVVEDPEAFAHLTADIHSIEIRHAGLSYPHPWVLKGDETWRWESSTHEYLIDKGMRYGTPISGAYLVEHGDSIRRTSGRKLKEDRELLEAAYKEDPTDARTVFYLGQTCQDEGNYRCAIEWYRRRVLLGGWPEEAWCAQYRIGNCHDLMGNWDRAVLAYLAAHQMYPARAEAAFRLGKGFFNRHQFALAHLFFERARAIKKPESGLFIEDAVYDFASLWGLAWSNRALGSMRRAGQQERSLFASEKTPSGVKKLINDAIATRTFGALT